MTIGRWSELAELISEAAVAWVGGHDRLLRSLHWGDDDYRRHVLQFFRRFLGHEYENVGIYVDFLGLGAWLEGNEPRLYA